MRHTWARPLPQMLTLAMVAIVVALALVVHTAVVRPAGMMVHAGPSVPRLNAGRAGVSNGPVDEYPGAPQIDSHLGRALIGTSPQFAQAGGHAYIFDTRTGALIAVNRASPRLVVDERTGRAFGPNMRDNTVSMLDTATGRLVRTIRVGPQPYPVTIGVSLGRVFVPNGGGNTISVLDARSGTLLRTFHVRAHPVALTLADRLGRLFVVGCPGVCGYGYTLSVLDARTGRLVRTSTGTGPTPDVTMDGRTGRVFMVAGGQGTMLDARTGAVLTAVAGGTSVGPFAVGGQSLGPFLGDEPDGRVFATSNNCSGAAQCQGRVAVVDARSGRVVRTVAVGVGAALLGAVDGRHHRLFVIDEGRATVNVLDARTGAYLYTLPGPPGLVPGNGVSWPTIAVDERTGRAVVAAPNPVDSSGVAVGPARLAVIDDRTGARLRTLSTSCQPIAVAIDPRGGRAVVVLRSPGGIALPTPAPTPRARGWDWRRYLPSPPLLSPPPKSGACVVGGSGATMLGAPRRAAGFQHGVFIFTL